MAPQTTKPTVTFVGIGMGGFSLAAMMNPALCTVRLHDIDESRLVDLRNAMAIRVEGPDGYVVPLERVTADVAEAAENADIFVVCTGGLFQESVARSLAPFLGDGQIILLVQGNTGGALVFRRMLDKAGCKARIDIAEMDNFPTSWRRTSPTSSLPIVMKKGLQIAAFPGNRTDAVFARLGPLFPTAVAAPTIVSTSFMNANAMLHVANCVGNAGLIDRGGAYRFYAEGVTPGIARLYEAINAERVAIARALGADVPDLAEWIGKTYGVREATMPEVMQKLTFNSDGPYGGTPTPTSFAHKYIAEDVPVGLIPMREIGRAADVPTPAIDALITIASLLAGTDFAAEARTLDRMGLAGMDAAQIKQVVATGFA